MGLHCIYHFPLVPLFASKIRKNLFPFKLENPHLCLESMTRRSHVMNCYIKYPLSTVLLLTSRAQKTKTPYRFTNKNYFWQFPNPPKFLGCFWSPGSIPLMTLQKWLILWPPFAELDSQFLAGTGSTTELFSQDFSKIMKKRFSVNL